MDKTHHLNIGDQLSLRSVRQQMVLQLGLPLTLTTELKFEQDHYNFCAPLTVSSTTTSHFSPEKLKVIVNKPDST